METEGTTGRAAPWVSRLDLDTVVNSAQDLSLIEDALASPLTYAVAPYVDAAGMVVGEFGDVLVEAPVYYAPNAGPPKRRRVRAAVGVVGEDRWGLQVVQRCDCGTWGRCEHAMALLLDLTINAPMRDAVAHGRSAAATVQNVAALRSEALRKVAAQRAVRDWMPVTPRSSQRAHELLLNVVDAGRVSSVDASGYDFPAIELRFQDPRDRTLYDPAAGRGTLTDDDARVASLGHPLSRRRKGVAVVGVAASIALSLIRGREAAPILDGAKGVSVSFSNTALSLRFERARVSRSVLQKHYVEMGNPWRPSRRRPSPPKDDGGEADALVARWTSPDGDVRFDASQVVLFTGPFPLVWSRPDATFYPVDPTVDLQVAWQAHRAPVVEIPSGATAEFYQALNRRVGGRGVRLPRPEAMGLPPRETPTMVLRIEGTPLELSARLDAVYSFGEVATHASAPPPEGAEGLRRDLEVESEAMARVRNAGLRWSDDERAWAARDDAAVEFWRRGLAALREGHEVPLTIFLADKLRGVSFKPALKAKGRFRLVDGLLDTTLEFTAGELVADLADIVEALKLKRRWVALDDGSLAEINDAVAQLAGELPEVLRPSKDGGAVTGKLAAHQLGRVTRWIESGVEAEVDPGLEAFRAKLKELGVATKPEMPEGLNATMRPYQEQGLAWLQFLHALGVGGVLADDMGLGKTLTTLALLQWRREKDGPAVSLVVAPTSVASNWVREAARFTPSLKVLLLHGLKRTRDVKEIAKADVVVTTYALLRRDLTTLAGIRFRYVVLDEAQSVKNAGAQTRQAAAELDAEARLALTGTPVENRLGELWSIMDLCNPSMLGSASGFASGYERAVAMEPAGPAAERLRALVRPFLLRRTKREVLKDLPPKEEIDRVCALGTRQRRMYDALAATLLKEVEAKVKAEGMGKSGLAVLTALLRLRQMACDPRLVDAKVPATASAKRESFLELVQALTEEGRRVLVFSQFVELLNLWKIDLDRMGVRYEWLDGSTRDRDGAVQRFQTGTAPLFLISLKAGGTGLNLTAADTVIHCDPWWNPAVEDQATDRAHRIGQTRAVTVYRLIAKGTVEEKIQLLKRRKREIADAVVSAEPGAALRGLTAEDLEMLLGGSDEGDDGEE
ncbi:MAG: SNF2-related protein [Polyangiales bacterium]